MGKEIPWETRVAAEELYITAGRTFEQTAEATGVSLTQLKRWAAAGDWREKRREHRAALIAIRRDSVTLRKRLIKAALNSLDPQQVYAAARFEQVAAAAAARYDGTAEVPMPPADMQAINTPADAVAALQSVVEKKINLMLVKPDEVKLTAIKEVKQSLELIDKMRARYKLEDDAQARPEALSDAAAEEIRRRILGITESA